jgi:hypothetical protein
MKKIFLIIIFVLMPLLSASAGDAAVDLALSGDGIRISGDINNLIRGQSARVYTSIINLGNKDTVGLVVFAIGGTVIGQSPVSLTAGGVKDEVFVDFIIPEKDFNINVQLVNVSPQDQNIENNEGLSAMFHSQGDNDQDGLGDDIDSDDDNDGISDVDEVLMGLDKNKADTDADGVNDAEDKYPLDPKRSKDEPLPPAPKPIEPIKPSALAKPAPASTTQPAPNAAKPAAPAEKKATTAEKANKTETADKNAEIVKGVYSLPDAGLLEKVETKAEQLNWNTYNFSFTTNVPDLDISGLEYTWNYGDGRESAKNGSHRYPRVGEYYTTLKVKGPFGNILYDSARVRVKFWSVYNYWLWIIVLLFISFIALFRSGFKHKAGGVKPDNVKFVREIRKPKKREGH